MSSDHNGLHSGLCFVDMCACEAGRYDAMEKEIEQLRAANADLRDDIEVLVDHRVEYKAEIEQLRAALEPFAEAYRLADLQSPLSAADHLTWTHFRSAAQLQPRGDR